MNKRMLLVKSVGLVLVMLSLVVNVFAQADPEKNGTQAKPKTTDQKNQTEKTCEEFCTFKTDDAVNEDCLKACDGCIDQHVQTYPQLGHAVCSGSYGAWVDPNNTTSTAWLASYRTCNENRDFPVTDPTGKVVSLVDPVATSDMYTIKKTTKGQWSVESLNPYCYDHTKKKNMNYSSSGDGMVWWERIDGPLTFKSKITAPQNQPLLSNCTEPMTVNWLSNITNYNDFVDGDKGGCFKKANEEKTTDYRIVTICPEPGVKDQRNYLPNEQIACSKKLFEIKTNCQCQQLGLNAWIKLYEGHGSYVDALQNYYTALGSDLYFMQEDKDSTPTLVKTFATGAPDSTKVKPKTKKVKLSDYLKLDSYMTAYGEKVIDLKAMIDWDGVISTPETEKTIGTILQGAADGGLSWQSSNASTDSAFLKTDYARIQRLIYKIIDTNQMEDDSAALQFQKDVENRMQVVGLKTNQFFLDHATRIDKQLERWKTVVYETETDAAKIIANTPKNPLDNVGFLSILSAEEKKNDFIVPVSFDDFKLEYAKLEKKKVKLLKPTETDGSVNKEFEKFKILKIKQQDMQKKIWLIDKRLGSFKRAKNVASTSTYPVTQVLRTKYKTDRPNGSGGRTISPGSTESQMVLLKHERNEEYCQKLFIELNGLKKASVSAIDSEFQQQRDIIRQKEATYNLACNNSFVDKLIKTVAQILGTAGILLIIIGSYVLVTAQGDESQLSKGKNYLQYAAVGLVISFMSYTIVQFIIDAILW